MKTGYPIILKCGECGSLDVARIVTEGGRLVCLKCGHKGPPIREHGGDVDVKVWSGKVETLQEF